MRVMEERTLAMLECWQRFAAEERVFDVVPQLMRLTLNIASQALFTTDIESDVDTIQQTLEVGREFSVERASW